MFTYNSDYVNWDEPLGNGTYGHVYPYQKDPEDQRWAVKKVKCHGFQNFLNHMQEIVLGFSFNNFHVLPVKGYHVAYKEKERDYIIYIKLPRMKCSLKTVLAEYKTKKKLIPQEDIIQYALGLVLGLKYLHDRNIMHRDIKPDNILIDEDGNVKVADIGLGVFKGEDSTNKTVKPGGTALYSAPELSEAKAELKKFHLPEADLWSLGMVLFELCTQESLDSFQPLPGELKEKSLLKSLEKFQRVYDDKLLSLIANLLRSNPLERIQLQKVLNILTEIGESIIIISPQERLQKELRTKNLELVKLRFEVQSKDKVITETQERLKGVQKELGTKNLELDKLHIEVQSKDKVIADTQERLKEAQKELEKKNLELDKLHFELYSQKKEFEVRVTELFIRTSFEQMTKDYIERLKQQKPKESEPKKHYLGLQSKFRDIEGMDKHSKGILTKFRDLNPSQKYLKIPRSLGSMFVSSGDPLYYHI